MANYKVLLKDGDDYLYPHSVLEGIDTSNLLASIPIGTTYTATQDCWANLNIINASGNKTVTINGTISSTIGTSSTVTSFMGNIFWYPIKKGQSILLSGVNAKLDIYALKR